MKLIKKISLVTAIIPFIVLLFLSSINLNNKIRLKILIWETPSFSLGTFLAISGTLGFSYSLISIKMLTIPSTNFRNKRIYKSNQQLTELEEINNYESENESNTFNDEFTENIDNKYFERDLRDPTPTISIPYKIIKHKKNINNNSHPDNSESYNSASNRNNSDLNGKSRNQESIDDWSQAIEEEWVY